MAPSQSKQITIFGSTGPSGTALALAALNRGFTLVLYLRSPHKLAEQLKQGERVKVVVGNLDEEQKIKEAIQGSVAILSTLGPTISLSSAGPFASGQTPIADGNKLILSVMEKDQKFIAIATPTAWQKGDERRVLWNVAVGFIKGCARPAFEEIVGIGKAFSENSSKGSTVLVRIPLLGSNPESSFRGVKVSSHVGSSTGTFSKTGESCGEVGIILYREDLAEFMIDCVTDETWDGKWPLISS